MNMFINGFRYILPGQYRICSRKPLDQIINEQYQNMSKKIKKCLSDHNIFVTDARGRQAFSMLEQLVQQIYSNPLPKPLQRRAQYEYQVVRGICQMLRKRPDIVVRRTDKSKVFYIGKAEDFERKAHEYMIKTAAYEEIPGNRSPLADHLQAVQNLLRYLVSKKALTQKQAKYLMPKLDTLELGHYHGLPKPHKPGTPLRPIIASIHGPATAVSQFLNNLLAPIYLAEACETTFINGIDVVRRFEKYAADGRLTPTTKFLTADVTDLYTMIPRDGALERLARFCLRHAKQGKIGTLGLNDIMKLARLILDTNAFVYNNKYYRQIRGGAMGSAFTQVLANIYMLEWEQDLIQYQKANNEIYGRYIDDIIMTTNRTMNDFTKEIERAAQKDVNIKINYEIDSSVSFLDVHITNQDGRLRTKIYHKPSAEPYVLPYHSEHPRHIHKNIPYAAVLRAARICSHIEDFNKEIVHSDLSLLLQGYPPNFIRNQFGRLFRLTNFDPFSKPMDQSTYQRFHRLLLHQTTKRETKIKRASNDLVSHPLVLQPKIWNQEVMYPRYLFVRSRASSLQQKFFDWWHKHYAYYQSPVSDVKVIMVPDTQTTLETFLVHKKPAKTILKKMD